MISIKLISSLAALGLMGGAMGADFTNPIRMPGGDPFIVWDPTTSAYYFMATSFNALRVTTADTIEGLKAAPQVILYQDDTMVNTPTVWAPEIHKLNGIWYYYFSHAERPWVATGGEHPMDKYTNPVQLSQDFGIDGTVLEAKGGQYFIWACTRKLPDSNINGQSLCIAKMKSPTEIDSANIGVISQPTLPWEQHKAPVNEAPQAMYWGGETYLSFSASHCDTQYYSLGIMHLTGDDPLQKESWVKNDEPVFQSANGEYGTGHNGNFLSPDGTEYWNVFHSVHNPEGSCGDDRATQVNKIDMSQFAAKGPIYGQISKEGTVIQGPSGEGAQAKASAGNQLEASPTPTESAATAAKTCAQATQNRRAVEWSPERL